MRSGSGGGGGVINFLWCVSVFATRGEWTIRAGFHFTVLAGGNVEAGGVEGEEMVSDAERLKKLRIQDLIWTDKL